MVRTRTFDPDNALTSAMEVFALKGYSDTSMEDIVQATGVSRYGLYSAFGNKHELFEQTLERFAESLGKRSFLKLLEPEASLQIIRDIFAERVSDMCSIEERKGCLFVHSSMQLAAQDDEIRGVLQKFMKRMSKAFSIGLETAKGRGEVREDLDVRVAGDQLTSLLFGLAVLGRSGFEEEALNRIVAGTLASMAA